MGRYQQYRGIIDERLKCVIDRTEPKTMYVPARYVLEGGGKRIRPILVLLSCEVCGGRMEDAIDAGIAVEILHNFTLVHDDIMDNADQRRGRVTVHRKWDESTAILVGDELIGIAYKSMLQTVKGDIHELVSVFTDGMIEVCEGQSYDKEFEARTRVTHDEYLMMIRKKTGRLVSMSAELGAIIGNAEPHQRGALLAFAEHIGRAFQIQDDLLDVVADEQTFGKSIGGDIIEGKKTYLLVNAMAKATGSDFDLLMNVAAKSDVSEDVVETVREIYERLEVLSDARNFIRSETDLALKALSGLEAGPSRDMLAWFAEMLLQRSH